MPPVLLREPTFKVKKEFMVCRNVLLKWGCFGNINMRPWHRLSRATRFRYVAEANRHSNDLPCSKLSEKKEEEKDESSSEDEISVAGDREDYDGDADVEMSDADGGNDDGDENDEGQREEDDESPVFVPGIEYDETNWPTIHHDEGVIESIESPDTPGSAIDSPVETPDNVEAWMESRRVNDLLDVDSSLSFPEVIAGTEDGVGRFDVEFGLILRHIAIERHLSGETVDYIMRTLRKNHSHEMFQKLPKSHKTLYKQNRFKPVPLHYEVEEWNDLHNAKFCYVGVEKRLEQYFPQILKRRVNLSDDTMTPHVKIIVNVDGVKLADKGIMKCMWPVTIRVHSVALGGFGSEEEFIDGYNPPLFVALYHGSKGPLCFRNILRQFAAEMIRLHPSSEEVEMRNLTCEVFAFICDTPARAHCKDTFGLTFKFPCEKCKLQGYKLGTNFMSIWDDLDKIREMLRTDEEFATDENHVQDVDNLSPLTTIPGFRMVSQFPLDTMHSVYHGGVKCFLLQLFNGTIRHDNALPFIARSRMRKIVDVYQLLSPCEFRSTRLSSLDNLKDYKAAVMRHFILYIAVPLFYQVAPREVYELVTALVVALFVLGGVSPTPVPEKDLKLGRELLNYFVLVALDRHFSRVATPGMHMLLHIADDCETLGCHMDYLGAWPFENSMKILLHSKRSNHRAIQQIFNRESERLNCQLPTDVSGRIISLTPSSQYIGAPQVKLTKPKMIKNGWGKKTVVYPKNMGDFRLKANVRDAFCVVSTGARSKDFIIVQCTDFFLDEDANDGGIIIVGHGYKFWSSVFDKPKPSFKYHVYKFKGKLAETMKFRAEKVVTKLYALPDLQVFENDRELDSIFRYSATPYPNSNIWAPKKLVDFPCWFGVGIRHITQKGSSLY
jgi:hypothetical protein